MVSIVFHAARYLSILAATGTALEARRYAPQAAFAYAPERLGSKLGPELRPRLGPRHGPRIGSRLRSRLGSRGSLGPRGAFGQNGTVGTGASLVREAGSVNNVGVTRYGSGRFDTVKSTDGYYWGDPGNAGSGRYSGATSLAENVSWGWHHPNGIYNTIPVGAPLIDNDMNIYLASDDGIRKFSADGDLLWTYATRGQLACAPSLLTPTAGERHGVAPAVLAEENAAQENDLRPDWVEAAGSTAAVALSEKLGVGDRLKVRYGLEYGKGEDDKYQGGDVGEVAKIVTASDGVQSATIVWPRTEQHSVVRLSSLGNRFMRVKEAQASLPGMLLGSTETGFVFALDIMSGEEQWATHTSERIHGVKGSISSRNGIVVVATNRCFDQYCYRYRNQSNPFVPGNQVVRGLLAIDGSEIWQFRPFMPVWNFVPQYSKDGTSVMFSDFEGGVYCLDLTTGTLIWQHEGSMGTHVGSHAVYFPDTESIFAMGMQAYVHRHCNPFRSPGILPSCGTWAGSPGWIKALNATSGRQRWELETPEPPASAGLGMMEVPQHTRLIVGLGHHCHFMSPSQIWAIDPDTGHVRWEKQGPTLLTDHCAGDKEGADIRRAMTGRTACEPGAWSAPVIDSHGDLYIGTQVGELQRWGNLEGLEGDTDIELLSTLSTGVAFQDQAIALAPGMMAVSTCTSLIVFQTYDNEPTISSESWDLSTET
jgi:outer membrane protein assembly factor BamB